MKQLLGKRTWLQILFWGLLWMSIPFLQTGRSAEFNERFFYYGIVVFVGIVLIVIINVEVLIPKLYFNGQQTLYFLSGVALIAFITFLDEWDATPWEAYFQRTAPPRRRHNSSFSIMRAISNLTPYLVSFVASALIEIASFANRKAKEAADFRHEKLDSEMKFLKSQFNPHFLFNALNNIYSLSVIKSDKTPDNLLKLSGMLRYMLYDCKADKVTLGKEIAYLKNFIDLHLLKDSKGLNVKIELDETQPDMKVAPMLLVPFIENAFKHSRIEDLEKGWIEITLQTKTDQLNFEVSNSMPTESFTKDKIGGIGLENVKRQLELMYPERHRLDIRQDDAQYQVLLSIETN